jgi:hypothetical protein
MIIHLFDFNCGILPVKSFFNLMGVCVVFQLLKLSLYLQDKNDLVI